MKQVMLESNSEEMRSSSEKRLRQTRKIKPQKKRDKSNTDNQQGSSLIYLKNKNTIKEQLRSKVKKNILAAKNDVGKNKNVVDSFLTNPLSMTLGSSGEDEEISNKTVVESHTEADTSGDVFSGNKITREPTKVMTNKNDKREYFKTNTDSDSVLSPLLFRDLEDELESKLKTKAAANNLTARHVKNILKAVIMNSEVLKMVDQSLKKSEKLPPKTLIFPQTPNKSPEHLKENTMSKTSNFSKEYGKCSNKINLLDANVENSTPRRKNPKTPSKSSPLNEQIDYVNTNSENAPVPSPLTFHHLEEEIEEELENKAEKNHFTARNVKNMIKAVITNSEVLKMVEYSLNKTEERPLYELKLTRAKTKVLEGVEQNALFKTPAPKNSGIEALITQDLPDDSSDEEYEPVDEISEDEESKASEAGFLDDGSEIDTSVGTIDRQNGNAENIGQRTRSKLSLSSTPLETIEQAFIPPDITTDMYNTDCDNEDWLNFLKEFMQPLDTNQQEINDDDNDPEYNVMVDEEAEAIHTDKEELRADRAVKVTKKEFNELMSELFEYTQMLDSDEDEVDKNISKPISEQTHVLLQPPDEEPPPQHDQEIRFSTLQFLLLKQQLQQHVQLLIQTYLLSCGLPEQYDFFSKEAKSRLHELLSLKQSSGLGVFSFFNIINLESSIKLMNEWYEIVTNSPSSESIKAFISNELKKFTELQKKRIRYRAEIPQQLIKICLESDAFIYTMLLPLAGFSEFRLFRTIFTTSEEYLIAIGIEEFSLHLGLDICHLNEIAPFVCQYLSPPKTKENIIRHTKHRLKSAKPSILKELYETQNVPPVEHFVVVHETLKVLSSYDVEFFPDNWKKYLTVFP